jgi:putative ABC transport system permease protein
VSAPRFTDHVRRHLPPLALPREGEIVEELAEHLDDLYNEARAQGLDHDAAWRLAAAALPAAAEELAAALRTASRSAPDRAADRWRAALDELVTPRSGPRSMFTGLGRDLRDALRAFTRAPGFTAVAVLTMALGMAATAVVFSAVDALLLRSVPVTDAGRLVRVYSIRVAGQPGSEGQLGSSFSYPDYVDLRDSGVLSGLATFANARVVFDSGDSTEPMAGEVVSGNYFDVLGVRPALGRTFAPEEDLAGSPVRVVMLSNGFWRRQFNADAGVVGRSISLNGRPYTVIGVAPAGFGGVEIGDRTEVWVPMALQEEVRLPSAGLRREMGSANLLTARGIGWLDVVGRLREGDSVAQAAAALDAVGRRLAADEPEANRNTSVTAVPLGEGPGVRKEARPVLALLGGAVLLVLLIACANVASLLLARAISRRREVAVRMAIGAGAGQLVRQWLTEAVLLGVMGAAAGTVIAMWGAPLLYGLGIPTGVDLGINWRVFAFTLSAGVATGVVFGLAPVVQLLRGDTVDALREQGGSVSTGARATRLRSTFVVVQVALSLVLLVGAGLLLRTLQAAYAVDLGYRVDHMLIADVDLDPRGYSQEAGAALWSRLLERLNALPGVEAAAAARITVLSGSARTVRASLDGQPPRPDGSNLLPVRTNVVSAGYLSAMGVHVLRGRGFEASDTDDESPVTLVSRSLAVRLWPGEDPIGRTLVIIPDQRLAVVGVVPDTVYRSATERDPLPFFYQPLGQAYESGLSLHLRTAGDAMEMLPSVKQVVRDLDPQLAVTNPRRLLDDFDRSVGDQRTMAMLVGLFSAIALAMAAVGLYGVMAYITRQRTGEIGLRLALGATPGSILGLTMGRGLRLVTIGGAIGFLGALAAARYLESRLFGVAPGDPETWLSVAAILLGASLLACLVPARRAMRTDPAIALRAAGN